MDAQPPGSKLWVCSPPLLALLELCAKFGLEQTRINDQLFNTEGSAPLDLVATTPADVPRSGRTGGS